MSDLLLNLFAAIAASMAYGILGYAKNLAENPQTKWSTKKFLVTILFSMIIGFAMALFGVPVTQESFLAYALGYGYLTVMLEKLVEAANARFHFF